MIVLEYFKRILTPKLLHVLDLLADSLILLNLVALVMLYSFDVPSVYASIVHKVLDFSLIYLLLEVLLRMLYLGKAFWCSRWCVFDLVMTLVSLLTFVNSLVLLRSLRFVRLLRFFRQFSINQHMRKLLASLTLSLGSVFWSCCLIIIVFVLYAIIGVECFASSIPQYFGDFYGIMFTLFQCMTLEDWASGIARQTMDIYSWAWLYFVSFIVITNYVLINLIVGIITTATLEVAQADATERVKDQTEALNALADQITELRKEIRQLKQSD